jgi:hypothetical protein
MKYLKLTAYYCLCLPCYIFDMFNYFGHLETYSGLENYPGYNFENDLIPKLNKWISK